MDRTLLALSSIAWTLVLVGAAMGLASVGPATAAVANEDARPDSYAVEQNDRCIPMTPIGDAAVNVSDHYDYRSGPGDEYSSHGTTDLQVTNASQLYVYRGSDGDSLVVLHDLFGENKGGGSASMTFAGVPDDGTWPVLDDDYDQPDDQYDTNGSEHTMDWMWAPNRTDGGAFRGIAEQEYDGIEIDATFGEGSYGAEERDPEWPYAHDNVSWYVRNGEGDLVPLEEDDDATLRRGDCRPDQPPEARLGASPDSPRAGEDVTFDASNSSDDDEIVRYRWNVNGSVENTTSATYTHRDATEGELTASVEVVDSDGNTATATTTVEITGDDAPTADLTAQPSTTVGESVTLDASGSDDDNGVVEYLWDLDGNGTIDVSTTDPQFETAYDTAGEFSPNVTVVDSAGQTDTASMTIAVTDGDDPPNASLQAPSSATVGESVALDASGSEDDDGIVQFEWDVDGDGTVENVTTGPQLNVTYDTAGEYTPTVTALDSTNQTDEASASVDATQASFSATIDANRTTVEPGDPISFDADAPADLADGYRYTFGDEADATGASTIHAYDESGNYTVSVNVSSTDGRYATASTDVTVESGDASTPGDGGDDDDGGGAAGGGGGGAALPPPGTPSIGVATASVDRSTVERGSSVGVDVELENSGDGGGTTRVALTADGETVETLAVHVDSNSTVTHRMDHAFEESGTYDLSVNGTSAGTLTVTGADDENAVDAGVGGTDHVHLVDVASPAQSVPVGDAATIEAILENRGEESTTTDVPLLVEGDVSAVQQVTVPAGESKTVTFNRTFASAGEYAVGVDGTNQTVVVGDARQGRDGGPGEDTDGENGGSGDPVLLGVVGIAALVGLVLGLSRWV